MPQRSYGPGCEMGGCCRLLELKALNTELMKQNEEKDRELARLHKSIADEAVKLEAAYRKTRVLEERNRDVGYVT